MIDKSTINGLSLLYIPPLRQRSRVLQTGYLSPLGCCEFKLWCGKVEEIPFIQLLLLFSFLFSDNSSQGKSLKSSAKRTLVENNECQKGFSTYLNVINLYPLVSQSQEVPSSQKKWLKEKLVMLLHLKETRVIFRTT